MKLLRQGGQFALIGTLQFVVDWGVFVMATWLGLSVPSGNLLGRISGAVLGFWLNGRYTFAGNAGQRPNWRHLGKYAVLWIVMTVVSTGLMTFMERRIGLQWTWLAKPLIEAGLAIVNFFLCRHVVYR